PRGGDVGQLDAAWILVDAEMASDIDVVARHDHSPRELWTRRRNFPPSLSIHGSPHRKSGTFTLNPLRPIRKDSSCASCGPRGPYPTMRHEKKASNGSKNCARVWVRCLGEAS